MLESKFQAHLIEEIESRFPGCIVVKNDSGYLQGIPDLTVFYGDRWAWLECKKSERDSHQPNQDYYIDWANKRSFGRFIFPENEEEVLCELQQAFRSYRKACISRCK